MPVPGTIKASPRIVNFAIVGCVGFLADAAVLYGALYILGVGFYIGRLISYTGAASVTWYLNRRITFAGTGSRNALAEWGRFLAFNTGGGIVNYGVYAAIVHFGKGSALTPAIGVGVGSLTGMTVNYSLSKWFVFTAKHARL